MKIFDEGSIKNFIQRERIKLIRMGIITSIFILFLIPTILCIILAVKLDRLQEQVNDIMKTNAGKAGISETDDSGGEYDRIHEKYYYSDSYSKNEGYNFIYERAKKYPLQIKRQQSASKNRKMGKNLNESDNIEIKPGDSDYNVDYSEDTGKSSESIHQSELDGGTDNTTEANNSEVSGDKEHYINNEKARSKEDNGTENNNKEDLRKKDRGREDSNNSKGNIGKNDSRREKNSEDGITHGFSEENNDSDEKNSGNDEKKGKYHGKKVYITFDDGPSSNTDKILDILAEYNVKATFFVIGKTDEESLKRYKRIVDEGHTLGMHSYSHDYKQIYNSLEDFDKDFTKLRKLLYDTVGFEPFLYRFPGGSYNSVSKEDMKVFIRYLNEKGVTYYDWNVVNGDAEGKDYTEEEMIDKVLTGVEGKNTAVVLMHDANGKDKTVACLPKILDALISGGAELLPLDENAPLIQQIKASSVK